MWRGSKRSFDNFVNQLNREAAKFGIKFPLKEIQFGKSVDFLDLTVYLGDDNTIQYKGYTKPTDAKRYLNVKSFHPRSVFKSIPYSQILRTIENNSKETTRTAQLNELVEHFENSGYSRQTIQDLKQRAIEKNNNDNTDQNNNTMSDDDDNKTLVFPVHYFEGIQEFKTLVRNLEEDFRQLIGETRVMFALKKGTSIGNALVRNKALCAEPTTRTENQKCNAPGCLQCPLVNEEHQLTINNTNIKIPRSLNCKTRNVIYLWKCKLCHDECYFGRTTQKCHARTNGHRSCFNDEEKVENSALSMHAKETHDSDFNLKNFKISIVKKISPQNIRREEFKFIEKFRTIQLGLNRYKAS